ncbi:MAG: hypothetical protein WC460_02760 [Patescibacteria group bacterium]
MARKKAKQKTKKKLVKKIGRKKVRSNLGTRIKVKEEKEAAVETIVGASLSPFEATKDESFEFESNDFEDKTERQSFNAYDNPILIQEADPNEEINNEISQADEAMAPQEQINPADSKNPEPWQNLTPRQKNLIMYISLTCVMVIIVGFWFVGLKASFGQNLKGLNFNINEVQGVKQGLNSANQQISEIKTQLDNQASSITDIKNKAEELIIEEQIKNDVAQKLKDKLQNQNINSEAELNANTAE